MIALWVLAVAFAVVSADVSHLGYNYKVPQTSYGLPSYQYGSSSRYSPIFSSPQLKGSQGQYLGSSFGYKDAKPSASSITGFGSLNGGYYNGYSGLGNGLNSGKYFQTVTSAPSQYYASVTPVASNGQYFPTVTSTPSSVIYESSSTALPSSVGLFETSTPVPISVPSRIGEYFETSTPASSSFGQYYGAPTVQPFSLGSGIQYGSGLQYGSQYAGQYETKYQQQFVQQPAEVYKHFYVHAAPEEPEEVKSRAPIVLPPPQKHYKIIFVKTPESASRTSQIVPVQSQNEEKTIVYVLSKKPEEQQEIIAPKVEQKPPSKPEVYFIKYNNKGESQAVINNIVNDYSKDGQTVSVAGGGIVQDTPVYSGADFSGASNYPIGVNSFSNFPTPSTVSIVPTVSYPTASNLFSGSSLSSGSSFPISSAYNTGLTGFSGSSNVPSTGFIYPSSGLSSGSNSGSSGSSFSFGSGLSGLSGSGSGLSGSSGSNSFAESSKAPSSSFTSQSFNSDSSLSSISSLDSGSSASSSSGFVSNPVTTTTASSVVYDDVNNISTSQGIPHESYGPPKFRVD